MQVPCVRRCAITASLPIALALGLALAATAPASASSCDHALLDDPAGDQVGAPALGNADLRGLAVETSDQGTTVRLELDELSYHPLATGAGLDYFAILRFDDGDPGFEPNAFVQARFADGPPTFHYGAAHPGIGVATFDYLGTTTGSVEHGDGRRASIRIGLPEFDGPRAGRRITWATAVVFPHRRPDVGVPVWGGDDSYSLADQPIDAARRSDLDVRFGDCAPEADR